jgi:hypothetical protein
MSRGLVTRLHKLEARRRNEGEILLLWRGLGKEATAVAKAAKGAGLFASGDRVISAEWLGDDPMPAPRWVKVSPSGWLGLTEREKEYCEATVRKLVVDDDRRTNPDPVLLDWTDADLWHAALGVSRETQH